MERNALLSIFSVLLMVMNGGTIAFGEKGETGSTASENKEEFVLKTSERQFPILEPDEMVVFPEDARTEPGEIASLCKYGHNTIGWAFVVVK